MTTNEPRCVCQRGEEPLPLVYPCSGAADVGEIADRAARLLDAEDKAWMSCLAGIGGRVSGLVASAEAAPVLVAIDGCPQDCASKTLRLAGLNGIRSVRVTDAGLPKGRSPVTPEAVRAIAHRVELLLSHSS